MKRGIAALLIVTLFSTLFSTAVWAADDDNDGNIALGAKVTASTYYSDGYEPEKAVDGQQGSCWSSGSNSIDGKDSNGREWLMVDLGGFFNVTRVAAYARNGNYGINERSNWEIYGSLTKDFAESTYIVSASGAVDAGGCLERNYDEPQMFRYIMVRKSGYIVVSEMKVYGERLDFSDGSTPEDLQDEKYYDAERLNSCLQTVPNTNALLFGTGNLVKKSDADIYIANMISARSDSQEGSGMFETAAELGLMPYLKDNEYVKVSDFLIGGLCAAGYGEYLAAQSKSPSDASIAAQKLGKRLGVLHNDMRIDEYALKGDVLRMIYGILIAPMYDLKAVSQKNNGDYYREYKQGDTLLQTVYDMDLSYGVVTANPVSALDEAVGCGDGNIEIGNVVYKDESSNLSNMLAHSVMFVTDDKGEKVWYAWEDKSHGKSETIYTDDIEECSNNGIKTTDENGKHETYRLDRAFSVIKNGVAYGAYTNKSFEPDDGYIELYDTDDNGSYDVVKIFEPQICPVSFWNVDTSESEDKPKIVFSDKEGHKKELNSYDMIYCVQSGVASAPSELSRPIVVYLYESEDGRYAYLDLSSKNAKGILNSLSDDSLEIGDNEYEYSEYYKTNAAKQDKLIIGDTYTMYLNGRNKVVYVTKTEYATKLGYIVKATAENKGIIQDVLVKMYVPSEGMSVFKLASKCTIDSVQKKSGEVVNIITNINENYLNGVPAKYKLDDNGDIMWLDTPNEQGSAEDESMNLSANSPYTGYVRLTNGVYMTNSNNFLFPLPPSTPVFVVPIDGSGVSLYQASDDERYIYTTAQSAVGNGSYMYDNIYLYGCDENGIPEFCVRKTYTNTRFDDIGFVTSYTPIRMIINNVSKVVVDDEICYKINGYNVRGGEVTYITKPGLKRMLIKEPKLREDYSDWFSSGSVREDKVNTLDDNYVANIGTLKKGDLVSLILDGQNIKAVMKTYDSDDMSPNFNLGYGANMTVPNADTRVMGGTVEKISASDGIISFTVDGNTKQHMISELNYAYIYEKNGAKSSITKLKNPSDAEANYAAGDRIIAITAYGSLQSIIIYK